MSPFARLSPSKRRCAQGFSGRPPRRSTKSGRLLASGFSSAALAFSLATPQLHAADLGRDAVPLEKVVIFTSGVGYFQHGGEVDGATTVQLDFQTDEINDLLKSMVVQDLGGGASAPTVSYASRDPITKTLASFAIDLTDDPSIGTLLGRLRGEQVELQAASPVTGTILGVETRLVPTGDDRPPVEKDYITILADDGLRTVALETVTRIRLVDADLQKELEKALAVLASAHDSDKKQVTIRFPGEGRRDVRIGYVQEMPLWKTSYRLVIDEDGKAFLQGWAIVENTTDHDWDGVDLTLVSGRPISFVMDLYQPLYVPRPEVQPEVYASLLPQVYGQDMLASEAEFLGRRMVRSEPQADSLLAMDAAGGMGGGMGGMPPPAAAAAPGMVAGKAMARGRGLSLSEAAAATRSLAEGGDLGELFRYAITEPVTLARQQSAMLPIVSGAAEVEKLAVYDEQVLAKHPLSGVRLKNTTGLNLMQGPLTVFEADAYAGDARIEDLPPESSRLMTYAVELDVEVAPRSEFSPELLTAVKLSKGTLIETRKLTRKKIYDVRNSSDEDVAVLVEHPLEAAWQLTAPAQPDETTRDRYRFAVQAKPGEPASLTVAEEQIVHRSFAITNFNDDAIVIYIQADNVSPAVKAALQEVVSKKQAIALLARERQDREQEIAAIGEEQSRIRDNMSRIDRTSDLYTRYVQKFDEQETRIEDLREEIATRLEQEHEAQAALDTYMISLEIE
jgi:hypothetical protein